MFGFRKVRPPLSTYQRVDIELLMRRTIEKIGAPCVCRAAVVTDLAELQLDRSDPDRLIASASRELTSRLPAMIQPCEITSVDGTKLGYPSTYVPATSHAKAKIFIADETLTDPLRTMTELSYQYANHFWHTTLDPTALDTNPRTTNLLPICCGLGVLASDACLYDQQWSQAGWTGWSISRSGYYTAVEIGYAMALIARVRGETNPKWAGAMRLDSKETAKRAWRYFDQHEAAGHSLLFDAAKVPATSCEMHELASWLRGDDPAFALAAGYALLRLTDLTPLVMEAALEATRSSDQDLVPVAARLLGGARRSSHVVEARIRQLIASGSPSISLSAIQSAAALGMPLHEFASKVSRLLDRYAGDAFELIEVIAQQGKSFEFMGPQLCEQIAAAIRQIDDDSTGALLDCLQQIVSDPKQSIQIHIKSPEIRKEALQRLASLEATERR